jgi:hypothetical protein
MQQAAASKRHLRSISLVLIPGEVKHEEYKMTIEILKGLSSVSRVTRWRTFHYRFNDVNKISI